jgi:hypothetical protein
METYVVVRRRAWQTHTDAWEAVARASLEATRLSGIVTCAQTYVVEEIDGTIGSICVYDAVSPEAVRHHSDAAELPLDEIVKVADTFVVRPDPAATAA